MKKLMLVTGLMVIFLCQSCGKGERSDHNPNPDIKEFTFETLSAYQRKVLTEYIDYYFPNGKQTPDLLTDNASIRTITRLAEALLFRNNAGDRENAFQILEWVLKYQNTDITTPEYGVWRTSVADDRKDQNWREFVGCDLIIIYQKYKSILPETLRAKIENGLLHAAKGASIRDVSPYYTNISVMSAFLMEFTGSAFRDEKLRMSGIKKAKEIQTLFQSQGTFSEFNSPTYYGVTMVGLALWREMAFSAELREMGKSLERNLWTQMGLFYNASLKNFCGPYFRGYGMDVMKYNAIAGIWIAMALNDENLAPLPRINGAKYDELSNIVPVLHLGIRVSENDLKCFRKFPSAQNISQLVPNKYPGDSLKKVTAFISEHVMMGGVWGSRRPWGQIKAGTIHWAAPGNGIGWILIPGDGKTNIEVKGNCMKLYLADRQVKYLELFLNQDPASSLLTDTKWKFPGKSFGIKTSLKINSPEKVNQNDFKDLLEIAESCPSLVRIVCEIPENWDVEIPVIEITPEP